MIGIVSILQIPKDEAYLGSIDFFPILQAKSLPNYQPFNESVPNVHSKYCTTIRNDFNKLQYVTKTGIHLYILHGKMSIIIRYMFMYFEKFLAEGQSFTLSATIQAYNRIVMFES